MTNKVGMRMLIGIIRFHTQRIFSLGTRADKISNWLRISANKTAKMFLNNRIATIPNTT